jgi:hypothetical protein
MNIIYDIILLYIVYNAFFYFIKITYHVITMYTYTNYFVKISLFLYNK